MNSRDYKILQAGNFYHVYNRGNNKKTIFIDTRDYFTMQNRMELALGKTSSSKVLFEKHQLTAQDSTQRAPLRRRNPVRVTPFPIGMFSIVSYCLMPNHFHFLIRQNFDICIDRLMARVCTSYAKYFNEKYGHVGNVFQDRFKAKLVDNDEYLKYLSAYIHNNPADPLNYKFSSFRDYCGLLEENRLCEKDFLLGLFDNNSESYKKFVLDFSEKDRKNIETLLFEE